MAYATFSVEGLSLNVGRVVAGLAARLQPAAITEYFASLGTSFGTELSQNGPFTAKLDLVAQAANAVGSAADTLEAAEGGDSTVIGGLALTLTGLIGTFLGEVAGLATVLINEKNNLRLDPDLIEAFALGLPAKVLEAELVLQAERKLPLLASLALAFGILERSFQAGSTGDGSRPPFVSRRLTLSQLDRAVTDPLGLLLELYGFGGANFGNPAVAEKLSGALLMRKIAEALELRGNFGVLREVSGALPTISASNLTASINGGADVGLKFAFRFPIPNFQVPPIDLTDPWSVSGSIVGPWPAQLPVLVQPGGMLKFLPEGGTQLSSTVSVDWTASPTDAPAFGLIGVAGASRIEVASFSVGLPLTLSSAGSTSFALRFAANGAKVVIALGEGDGFAQSLTGSGKIKANFDLAAIYEFSSGLKFEGGALEISLPLHVSFGGVSVNGLKVQIPIGAADRPGLPIDFSTAISATFGPFTMVVDQIGLTTDLTFSGPELNLGIANFKAGFKAPTGIGVSIDGGGISGGGFLSHDPATGRYAGAIELRVFLIGVKAFGVLDTRFPDGSEGVSFVVLISAEFTPIQLGFGFTLVGVGGLLGINRTVAERALGDAVRTGALGHLLFPRNPVQDAPAIINDLATVFPATRGHQLFGPMAKLGWGTPTLITADLGIVIEFPGPRLALLGVVHMVLPSAEFPLIAINCAVAGLLDFPAGKMSINASLFDSRVAGYVVSGDMAYRLEAGDAPTFLLSVGGFNPGFKAPARFPDLRRASVDLGVSGNPRLTASGYFALTSNSAQLGGRIDLRVSAGGFRVRGHFGFDTLFVFSPFRFSASISAGIRVEYKGVGFGVTLRGDLKGPTPWHFTGRVCVDLEIDEVCLRMSIKFGRSAPAALPEMDPWFGNVGTQVDPRVQVIGLGTAVSDARNWQGEEPEDGYRVVSLAQATSAERVPIDPVGPATLRQRVCPLNQELEKFGEYRPVDHTVFNLTLVSLGGQTLNDTEFEITEDLFAPAHFSELSRAQRLSNPSYDTMDAGVKLTPNRVAAGPKGQHVVAFETVFIKASGERVIEEPTDPRYTPTDVELRGMLKRSAAALSGVRRAGAQKYMLPGKPKLFTLVKPKFVVANACDLTRNTSITPDETTFTKASLLLRQYEKNHPSDRNRFRVVPTYVAIAA